MNNYGGSADLQAVRGSLGEGNLRDKQCERHRTDTNEHIESAPSHHINRTAPSDDQSQAVLPFLERRKRSGERILG